MLVAGIALLFAAFWLLAQVTGNDKSAASQIRERAGTAQPRPPALVPQLYKPLTPGDAFTENEAIPFSTAAVERAPPTMVPISAAAFAGRRSALDCLTAAIYYEAGQETERGKRGVAQVVLNRARHPAFPNSICAVVYQGSERRTGCQFTFTCDGSLARKPSRAGWDSARRIAVAALSGSVEPSVGMATHYHADYVVPYWASSLAKIVKLDHHIFYRWSGGWGRRAAFSQSISQEQLIDDQPQIVNMIDLEPYSGEVPALTGAPTSTSRLRADEPGGKPASSAAPISTAPMAPPIRADELSAKPAADAVRGNLKVD